MIQRLQARRNDEGFTLVELLIVIIILAILAAIVVFAVGNTRKDSVGSACKTAAKSVELSLEAQNTKNGGYPAIQDDAILANKGALIKSWPSSTDYEFTYAGNTPANADGTFPGYTVTIGSTKKVVGGSWTNSADAGIATGCAGK